MVERTALLAGRPVAAHGLRGDAAPGARRLRPAPGPRRGAANFAPRRGGRGRPHRHGAVLRARRRQRADPRRPAPLPRGARDRLQGRGPARRRRAVARGAATRGAAGRGGGQPGLAGPRAGTGGESAPPSRDLGALRRAARRHGGPARRGPDRCGRAEQRDPGGVPRGVRRHAGRLRPERLQRGRPFGSGRVRRLCGRRGALRALLPARLGLHAGPARADPPRRRGGGRTARPQPGPGCAGLAARACRPTCSSSRARRR